MESTTGQMRVHEHLYALVQGISPFDGIAANLRDNTAEVFELGDGGRRETFTCAPRINDGGRLWFFDSWRRPVAQAGHPDAPLAVVQRLRETA